MEHSPEQDRVGYWRVVLPRPSWFGQRVKGWKNRVDYSDLPVPQIEDRPEKVAVIGSGPAGLTVAYYMRLKGYRVTIFEALDRPGGMLRVGIPDYRLPSDVLDREIDFLLRHKIDLKTNVRLRSSKPRSGPPHARSRLPFLSNCKTEGAG